MSTTVGSKYRVPTTGDVFDVPADMLRLATDLLPATQPAHATAAVANGAMGAKIVGQKAIIAGVPSWWDGTSWIREQTHVVGQGNTVWVNTMNVTTAVGFVFVDNVVLPAAASVVLITASWSYTSPGSSTGEVQLAFNNETLLTRTINTSGTRDQSLTIQAAVANRAAGTYGMCWQSMKKALGDDILWANASYSWVALG